MPTDNQSSVFPYVQVTISIEELTEKIQTSTLSQKILRISEPVLDQAQKIWQPRVVFRWLELDSIQDEKALFIIPGTGDMLRLDLGFSIKFLKKAEQILLTVYTAGSELEREAIKASSNGNLLESYLFNLIGMCVLKKTSNMIKEIAEKKAHKMKWGVSPFLSPGSVHGWELVDQKNVCSVLPLEAIGVILQDNHVFSPFQTVSGLIGLGPEYHETRVGTTCHLCSKRNDCPMKQDVKMSSKGLDHE